jgi:cytochrome c553
MKTKWFASLVAGWLALVPGAPVLASTPGEVARSEYDEALLLTPDLVNGRRVYLTCAVCHRPEGWGTQDGTYPQIAGQLRTVIIKQLADIRARNRDNPIMYPFAVPRIMGGARALADVAAYIARLPMTPSNGVGPGRDLLLGAQLYRDNCANCHGKHGQGSAEEHIPAVWGQHYHYLVRQFEWIKIGRRRNADPDMQKQIRDFSSREIRAVLDYVSRLKPPADKLASSPEWHNPDFPNYVRPPMPEEQSSY